MFVTINILYKSRQACLRYASKRDNTVYASKRDNTVYGVAILKSALTYKPLRRTNKTYKNSTMRSHNAPHARSLIYDP